jgi:hypothetical protein
MARRRRGMWPKAESPNAIYEVRMEKAVLPQGFGFRVRGPEASNSLDSPSIPAYIGATPPQGMACCPGFLPTQEGAGYMRGVEHFWAILLAAGEGERVRSLTNDGHGRHVPKQFWSLDGRDSLLQLAMRRAEALVPRDRMVPVVAAQHRHWWRAELQDFPPGNVVVQPSNKGTSAGILLPLAHVLRLDPGGPGGGAPHRPRCEAGGDPGQVPGGRSQSPGGRPPTGGSPRHGASGERPGVRVDHAGGCRRGDGTLPGPGIRGEAGPGPRPASWPSKGDC